jgi:hypothetical protein
MIEGVRGELIAWGIKPIYHETCEKHEKNMFIKPLHHEKDQRIKRIGFLLPNHRILRK